MATLLDWGNVDAVAAQVENSLGLSGRREAFTFLCLSTLLRVDFDEARGSLTDGFHDPGVDAAYLDKRFGRRVIHLFQLKCHGSFSGTNRNFPSTEIDKLLSIITDCFGQADQWPNDHKLVVSEPSALGGNQDFSGRSPCSR